jgi:hypothetical protein
MSRAELQELLDAIEEKMKRRAALRDEKVRRLHDCEFTPEA